MQDAVPNVRLRLVTLLPQVRATLQLPEDGQLLTKIESAIKELLLTEADRDVLAALQVILIVNNLWFTNVRQTGYSFPNTLGQKKKEVVKPVFNLFC